MRDSSGAVTEICGPASSPRQRKNQSEHTYGGPSGRRCCTLLLYSLFDLFELCFRPVELRRFELLTSCMPGGSTSTRVHPRRSPSLRVPASPLGSLYVAVLSAVLNAGSTTFRGSGGTSVFRLAQRLPLLLQLTFGTPAVSETAAGAVHRFYRAGWPACVLALRGGTPLLHRAPPCDSPVLPFRGSHHVSPAGGCALSNQEKADWRARSALHKYGKRLISAIFTLCLGDGCLRFIHRASGSSPSAGHRTCMLPVDRYGSIDR